MQSYASAAYSCHARKLQCAAALAAARCGVERWASATAVTIAKRV
jgi:hypothetical protein